MATFRFKGFTYELFVKPWKKGKAKYEALKWKSGLKCTWERISYDEFLKAKLESGN
jgi:hypothetical protein